MDVPVVRQRQVPTKQRVQKTVEVPQKKFIDKAVDVPGRGKFRQFKLCKTVEDPQVQVIDR